MGNANVINWSLGNKQFKKVNLENLHKWFVRFLCLVLTCQWYWFAVRWDIDPRERFAFNNLIWVAPQVFAIWNLGLWLSTTKWGARHKFITSILMIPAFIASPMEAGRHIGHFSWLILLVFLWSFWQLFKQRNECQ